MRLYVLSDLHLEQAPFTPESVDVDVIVLAGDVWNGTRGVEWARDWADGRPVLYVAGNHEFYGYALPELIEQLRAAAAGSPIHVLENDEVVIEGVRFLGCTLWSDFDFDGADRRDASMAVCARAVNDYKYITLGLEGRTLAPPDTRELHLSSRSWLEQRLGEPHDGATVVVTHHAPLIRGRPSRPLLRAVAGAFASDVTDLMGADRAALWVFGHTHRSADLEVRGTRVLSNPRGYPHQPVAEFDPGCVVEVPGTRNGRRDVHRRDGAYARCKREAGQTKRRTRMISHIPIGPVDTRRFAAVLASEDYQQLERLIEAAGAALRCRVVWNVNSTAKGGGVVELLAPLLGYSRGAGVDARWVVVSGDSEFFTITKRVHNHLHGFEGDGGPLGNAEHAAYERTLAGNAAELIPLIDTRDIVILHDPQTAALVGPVRATGARVIWRCHVGLDRPNDVAREAWDFLRPYVEPAHAYVFSRDAFAWEGLEQDRIAVIQPSIDVFAPKNADQAPEQVLSILATSGIQPYRTSVPPTFTRADGTPGRVDRAAQMLETEQLAADRPLVTQISRWDRLKDPLGVLMGFVDHVAPGHPDAQLLLAGPSTEAVSDDPEGAQVFAAVREAWDALPSEVKTRVHLASLPMDDVEENAAMVNALQRRSDVVIQKSLAEGFGLTVAEAMWKERPVVASRIGGIQDQIEDGVSGRLIADPADLREFGDAVWELLDDPERARRIGAAARSRVQLHFLGPHHLGRYFSLIEQLIGPTTAELRTD